MPVLWVVGLSRTENNTSSLAHYLAFSYSRERVCGFGDNSEDSGEGGTKIVRRNRSAGDDNSGRYDCGKLLLTSLAGTRGSRI